VDRDHDREEHRIVIRLLEVVLLALACALLLAGAVLTVTQAGP
jgi:hypothetical protein